MDDRRKQSQQDKTAEKSHDDTSRSADTKPADKPLRREAEGPDNLRRRAEWFNRRREGGKN